MTPRPRALLLDATVVVATAVWVMRHVTRDDHLRRIFADEPWVCVRATHPDTEDHKGYLALGEIRNWHAQRANPQRRRK